MARGLHHLMDAVLLEPDLSRDDPAMTVAAAQNPAAPKAKHGSRLKHALDIPLQLSFTFVT
jgi:hypothetical protein